MRNIMKRIITYSIALALLFMAETTLAQGYTFRVLANKGTNKVKKSSGQEVTLKTGATLNAGDQLVASEGAYIGLMHKTGRTIEVRKAGTMAVSDLEKKVQTGNTTVASRYAKFVNDKMSDSGGSGNVYSRQKATGAVSRKVGDGSLDIFLPDQLEVLSETVIINWEEETESETYIVTVKNILDEVIFETETNNTSIKLDFSSEAMQKDEGAGLYIFSVRDKNNEDIASKNVGIKRTIEDESLVADFESLKSEVPEDSPLSKLIYASFFEEKGLILDASTKYQEAIDMAPEVQDFQELYDNFLIVNGYK